ncbi:MAG TPA: anhydro-N-acetylmuramic acid kinase [Terriglobia bacterium]|nr:anhydro-N-acetylmuramic acid kinase [Terriglobia bacterium]
MTIRRARWAVGLISGTSMDGIDAALVQIEGPGDRPKVRLHAFQTFPYPPAIRNQLLRVASGSATSAREISTLNFTLGQLFADATLAVCHQGRVAPRKLTVIGSHGQTVFHQGPSTRSGSKHPGRTSQSSTLQLGEAAVIAERAGAPVVADFRAADMAAGGQGAPLVPLVDYLLLRHNKLGSVALNIGGIANVTVIPAGAGLQEIFGFDTGPGNMLIDGLVRHFTQARRIYDEGGKWAAKGKLLKPVLNRILRLPFFHHPPPKSAGREQFGDKFLTHYFLSQRKAEPADLIRTATEFSVRSIADALRRFVFPRAEIHRLIVSGGGAHNEFLVDRIRDLLPELDLYRSDKYGLPADAKEAIAFALLADRTLQGLPGNLPAVTGARRGVILGKISRP